MAGHSHWAGIKHKKGRADKERSKIFSKLSREITVAAKLGDKDPDMNPRLRTAIQAAKQSNMPKDNIARAISKSEMSGDKNYENLRYEGFGPSNAVFIIETLTDNKNRSASSIRTVLQKNGGRLGESGSTTHMFNNYGIIQFEKDKVSEEEAFEVSINAGAKDCVNLDSIFEIVTEKELIQDVYDRICKADPKCSEIKSILINAVQDVGRANTLDTLIAFKDYAKNCERVLYISIAPFIVYQNEVIAKFAKNHFQHEYETIGKKANITIDLPKVKIAHYLIMSFAEALYGARTRIKESLNLENEIQKDEL